jgi:SAM-dependent methyltransferase
LASKLSELAGVRRLNLGPGNHYADGWINADRYDLDHHDHSPDVLVDVLGGLPWDAGRFDQVYAGHLIEHVPFERVPELVAECFRVLAPGGELAVVGPDIEAAIRTDQPMWLLRQIVGDPTPETPGLGHEWVPTGLVAHYLVRRGWAAMDPWHPATGALVRRVPVGELAPPRWPNPALSTWQFGILATKPHAR